MLGDGKGRAIHLGERDCSLQRRHQKVWEESPSPALNAEAREQIGETVAQAMRELNYLGVGTVEFLYEDGAFYFIEMNTRIQVEHPVTEMITGIDLILEQIRVADGAELTLAQEDVKFQGHSIECRINAENPVSFRPSPGRILQYHPPGGLGVRVDSAVYQGYAIPPYYDSLLGKLIVHGKTRAECLMRLRRALDEFVVDGVETTLPLFRALVRDGDHRRRLPHPLAGAVSRPRRDGGLTAERPAEDRSGRQRELTVGRWRGGASGGREKLREQRADTIHAIGLRQEYRAGHAAQWRAIIAAAGRADDRHVGPRFAHSSASSQPSSGPASSMR